MPLQNRVLPDGEIVALAAKGGVMGNRGILHDEHQQLGRARWRHANWVCCVLAFRNRHRAVMQPGRYTELFFLDEAVALAAGHRPCAECRKADYDRFRQAWTTAIGPVAAASEMDRVLQATRVDSRSRRQIRHSAAINDLPEGSYVWHADAAWLLREDRLCRFTPDGYDVTLPRPARGEAEVMTPAPTVAVLRAGYRPTLHPSA